MPETSRLLVFTTITTVPRVLRLLHTASWLHWSQWNAVKTKKNRCIPCSVTVTCRRIDNSSPREHLCATKVLTRSCLRFEAWINRAKSVPRRDALPRTYTYPRTGVSSSSSFSAHATCKKCRASIMRAMPRRAEGKLITKGVRRMETTSRNSSFYRLSRKPARVRKLRAQNVGRFLTIGKKKNSIRRLLIFAPVSRCGERSRGRDQEDGGVRYSNYRVPGNGGIVYSCVHALARRKRELQVFEGLFWSGPKRSGALDLVCRFVCHGASRPNSRGDVCACAHARAAM